MSTQATMYILDDDDDVFIKHAGLPYGYAMRLQNKSPIALPAEVYYCTNKCWLSGGSNLRPGCILCTYFHHSPISALGYFGGLLFPDGWNAGFFHRSPIIHSFMCLAYAESRTKRSKLFAITSPLHPH